MRRCGSSRSQVSFQWENPDFLFENPDFLFRNPDLLFRNLDFPLQNVDFITKTEEGADLGLNARSIMAKFLRRRAEPTADARTGRLHATVSAPVLGAVPSARPEALWTDEDEHELAWVEGLAEQANGACFSLILCCFLSFHAVFLSFYAVFLSFHAVFLSFDAVFLSFHAVFLSFCAVFYHFMLFLC